MRCLLFPLKGTPEGKKHGVNPQLVWTKNVVVPKAQRCALSAIAGDKLSGTGSHHESDVINKQSEHIRMGRGIGRTPVVIISRKTRAGRLLARKGIRRKTINSHAFILSKIKKSQDLPITFCLWIAFFSEPKKRPAMLHRSIAGPEQENLAVIWKRSWLIAATSGNECELFPCFRWSPFREG